MASSYSHQPDRVKAVSYTHLDVYKRQLLERWEQEYAPQNPDEAWNLLFVEALQKKSYTEYLLDIDVYKRQQENYHV